MLGLLSVFGANASSASWTTTGKVAFIQFSGDHSSIYFGMDNAPSHIKQTFYVTANTASQSGCELKGTETSFDAFTGALMMAYAAGKSVTVRYCLDNNGYGAVSVTGGYIRAH